MISRSESRHEDHEYLRVAHMAALRHEAAHFEIRAANSACNKYVRVQCLSVSYCQYEG